MNENTNAMPPEEQAENDRDARAEELESTFSYDGYQVVRKELFAHLRDPAIVIRKDSITFNTACITGLEDVVYVHVMFNSDLKRIVVRGCDENDKDALRWCIAKPDKRKSRKMTCKPFSEKMKQTRKMRKRQSLQIPERDFTQMILQVLLAYL